MKKHFTLFYLILFLFVNNTGKVYAQNGNVGIGTNDPKTKLDITGGFSTQPTATTNVTGDITLTIGNSSYYKITTAVTIPANAKITLSNGLQNGQQLTLYVASDTMYGVELNNSSNLRLTKTPLNLMGRSASTFIWDGNYNMWIELGHVPTLPAKQVFTYSGTTQVFTVPVGISRIKVQLWGAGGGPGWFSSTRYASGGSGGYVEGYITVVPLQNISIVVGQGGSSTGTGRLNTGYSWGTGGGAAGGLANANASVGAGGGASYIYSGGTTYAVAGGGGGASGYPSNIGSSYGGAGGGTTGGNGGPGTATLAANSYGRGGTAAAGGVGGTSSMGAAYNGDAGTAYQGGLGGDAYTTLLYTGGGGGGGGRYGGGGGAGDDTPGWCGGGGGGSSYTGGLTGTIVNTQGNSNSTGVQNAAPNNTDAEYINGVGRGGYCTTGPNIVYDGGAGLIVFSW